MSTKQTPPEYDPRSTWQKSSLGEDGLPTYHSPAEVGVCPYVMTGNADERWDVFMVDVWQFAEWASETMVDEKTGEKYHPATGGRPWTFKVNILMSGPSDDLKPAIENGKQVVDGITLYAGDFGADIFMHFCELMGKLPCCYPDGELQFTNTPGEDRVVLHLWHD